MQTNGVYNPKIDRKMLMIYRDVASVNAFKVRVDKLRQTEVDFSMY